MLDCVNTCVCMLTIYLKLQLTVFGMVIFKLPVVDKTNACLLRKCKQQTH